MMINSVLGKISTDQLGTTLIHEHVICIDWAARMCFRDRWFERDKVIEIAVGQLKKAKEHGIDTIVDGTSVNLGRDIELMKEVSEKSGVNIIPSVGWYFQEEPYLMGKPIEWLIDLILEECERGIEGTGILPGAIKSATDKYGVTDLNKKLIYMASEVQKKTDLPIFAHSSIWQKTGPKQQDEFEKNGVDLRRIVIGHSGDSNDIDYLESIMKRGSYIGCDRFGDDEKNSLENRVNTICELIQRGWIHQICLSHDYSAYIDWADHSWQNTRDADWMNLDVDYSYIHRKAIPLFLERGLTKEDIDIMMVENPKNFFEGNFQYIK